MAPISSMLICFLALFLVSCAPQKAADPMADFLVRLPELKLPFEANLTGEKEIANHAAIDADSAFFPSGTRLIGWMRPSDSVVAVWYAAMGTDYTLPALRTFKLGKQLEDRLIGVGACGSGDCGFTCEEHFSIGSDGKFECQASVKVFQCDSAGNQSDSLVEAYSKVNSGTILASGKIDFRPAE